jgi:exopolyphosphatase / guanosine-5'-triphosphate,3'-diphosphate pyrophosphatase
MSGSAVGAAVDLGSTSVHLLVAAIDGHRLTPLIDESAFLGLGRTVAARGFLGQDARSELIATLSGYADAARGLGAGALTLIGTEPIRRSADTSVVVHEVCSILGAPLHVLSHEEEALLTIIGVTGGRPVEHSTLVIDVGGGSSEFCVIDPAARPTATGIRVGASALTDRHVSHDPPTAAEIESMYAAALDAVGDAPMAHPSEIVAVGGTVSNLRKIAMPPADTLGPESIAGALMMLGSMPAAVAAERYAINPMRARILPAGAAILAAILDRYDRAEIRVSEDGIREGTILAVAHAGPAWRDRLADWACGW